MANGQQLESGSQEREAYHQLFEELNAQVDESGNRSLAKVFEKHPFPIYEATVRRFRMIKERLPKDVEQSRGTDIEEFAVKVGGAAAEVLVAGFDLVWDVVTSPVHLTLYPRIRHPLYKAVLANLARNDGEEKINYTTNMAEKIPPAASSPLTETSSLPPDSPVPPTETMPSSLPDGTLSPSPETTIPPEPESEKSSSGEEAKSATAPPLGPEHSPHSPEREAFHRLVRDIFEVTEPALREDVRDRVETTATLGERTAQAWRDFTHTPWNVPRHVRQFDTALRGRDLGSLKMRLGRILVYNTVRAITAGIDVIDDVAKTPLQGIPGGGFISAGVEFLSDELIRAGTDWTVQQSTRTRQARFSSPIAVTANRVLNIVPILGWATNAPGLEVQMRNAYNLPIAGVPIEYLYTAANRWITQIERNPHGQLMERFVFAVLGGSRLEEAFRQEREGARS